MHIPRRVLQAAAALAAFPTFSTPAPLELPVGTTKVTFFVQYTEGAAGGRPVFRIEYWDALPVDIPPGEIARDITIDNAVGLTVVSPNGTFDFYMSQPQGPDPAGATIDYIISCRDLPGGIRAIRLVAAETGVPGTPGTMQIAVTGYGP